ncbi:hypothetical protein HQ571_02395 [Candidatus Kuenenbacteria bacterium]|nr:hypothetical protein [Candidatus Kuenenbacteria bacterium]
MNEFLSQFLIPQDFSSAIYFLIVFLVINIFINLVINQLDRMFFPKRIEESIRMAERGIPELINFQKFTKEIWLLNLKAAVIEEIYYRTVPVLVLFSTIYYLDFQTEIGNTIMFFVIATISSSLFAYDHAYKTPLSKIWTGVFGATMFIFLAHWSGYGNAPMYFFYAFGMIVFYHFLTNICWLSVVLLKKFLSRTLVRNQ